MRHAIHIFLAGTLSLACGCAISGSSHKSAKNPADDIRFSGALAHYAIGILNEFHYGPKSKAAIDEYISAAALDPETHHLYSRAAVIHFQRKETDKAIETFKLSCEKNPDNPEAWLDLAGIYDTAGRYSDAIDAASKALALSPSDTVIPIQLAKLHIHKGDDKTALKVLHRAMKIEGNRPILLRFCLVQGNIYLDRGEAKRAIPYFDMLIQKTTDKKEQLYNLLGILYESLGYSKEAINNFRMALKSDNPLAESFVMLAGILAEEDMQNALKTLREGGERLPGDPNIISALGVLYCIDKQNDAAIKTFEKLRNTSESSTNLSVSFYYYYGAACEQSGQTEKAEKIFEDGIKKFPDNHDIMNYLAYLWAEKGTNLDKALVYINRALTLDPANPAYMDTLGWIYYKQKKYSEALEITLRAGELMQDDSTIKEHIGDIKMAMGNRDSALEYWKQGLLLNPANKNIISRLKSEGISITDLPLKKITPAKKDKKHKN